VPVSGTRKAAPPIHNCPEGKQRLGADVFGDESEQRFWRQVPSLDDTELDQP